MTPIEKLSPINFLAVCDVVMDIKEELQFTIEDCVIIPLLKTIIRPAPFNMLFPGDDINTRDDYCSYRFKAVKYLKMNNYVESFKILEGLKRWDNQIQVCVDRKVFDKFYDRLTESYEKRVVEPNKKEEQLKIESKNIIAEITSINYQVSL